MARLPHALLALALLLGGCVSSDDPADPAPVPAAARDGGTDDASATAPSSAASSSPQANGTAPAPAATGGSAANRTASSNGTAEAAAAPNPRAEQVTGHGAVTLKLGTPCDAPDPVPCQPAHEAEPVHLALPEASPATSALNVSWTATTDAAKTLRFDVTDPDGAPLGTMEGESPLLVTLPPDVMRGVKEIVVTVVPATPGVVAKQEFDLALDLTYAA